MSSGYRLPPLRLPLPNFGFSSLSRGALALTPGYQRCPLPGTALAELEIHRSLPAVHHPDHPDLTGVIAGVLSEAD